MVIWMCPLTKKILHIWWLLDTWSCITIIIVSIWWWPNDASRHHLEFTGWCLQASSVSKRLTKYFIGIDQQAMPWGSLLYLSPCLLNNIWLLTLNWIETVYGWLHLIPLRRVSRINCVQKGGLEQHHFMNIMMISRGKALDNRSLGHGVG